MFDAPGADGKIFLIPSDKHQRRIHGWARSNINVCLTLAHQMGVEHEDPEIVAGAFGERGRCTFKGAI